jgi:uncharacterized protein YjbI with pentapeptide repeats
MGPKTSFWGCKLNGSSLDGVKADGAKFNNSRMENVTLSGAEMKDAKLINIKAALLVAKNATFNNCMFNKANLVSAKFSPNCDLSNSRFDRADLSGAVITGANVFKTKFCGAIMDGMRRDNLKREKYADFVCAPELLDD